MLRQYLRASRAVLASSESCIARRRLRLEHGRSEGAVVYVASSGTRLRFRREQRTAQLAIITAPFGEDSRRKVTRHGRLADDGASASSELGRRAGGLVSCASVDTALPRRDSACALRHEVRHNGHFFHDHGICRSLD